MFEVKRSLELFLMYYCCTHKSLRAGPFMLLLLPVFGISRCGHLQLVVQNHAFLVVVALRSMKL